MAEIGELAQHLHTLADAAAELRQRQVPATEASAASDPSEVIRELERQVDGLLAHLCERDRQFAKLSDDHHQLTEAYARLQQLLAMEREQGLLAAAELGDLQQEAQARIAELCREADALRQQLSASREDHQASQWFLGEERSKTAELQATLAKRDQELAEQRRNAEQAEARAAARAEAEAKTARERDEANWYLGELRAIHKALEQELAGQRTQADALAGRLARQADAAKRTGRAWWSGDERRRERRFELPLDMADQMVFHTTAIDGTKLEGRPCSISRSGVSVLIPPKFLHDTLQWTLALPDGATVHGTGRVVWREDTGHRRAAVGIALEGISEAGRRVFDGFFERLAPNASS